MANTFSQIYIQIVFAVKGRENLIHPSWEEELYKYISGGVKSQDQKLLAINGMPDHIHLLVGMKPTCCLSDLVREVKRASAVFIRTKGVAHFQWQTGFGAFSYSQSHVDKVIQYIMGQKEHHRKRTFKEEYYTLLQRFNIEFDEAYLFDWIE